MTLPMWLLMIVLMILVGECFDVRADDHSISEDALRQASSRQVNTKYGIIRGVTVQAPSLGQVEAFLGVPYATPPVGSLRFMPPVTPTHWRGVKTVDRLAPVCPQKLPNIDNTAEALKRMTPQRLDYLRRLVPVLRNQSEDCLYLNVWTPAVASPKQVAQPPQSSSSASSTPSSKVPVLVFLLGDSYDWNSGNAYDGSVLASFGQVVVVTLNYRLGVFGFLPAVVDGSVRGNYGLMDQVAALHWIQENIAEFGGSPNNVTIVGHGHGAACAHLLMISPMARGLFNRVILMSGSAFSPWAIARDADLYAKNLAIELSCPVHDSGAIVDCLRKKKFEDILGINLRIPDHLSGFGPIIDSIVVPSMPTSELKTSTTKGGKESLSSPSWHFDLMFGFNRLEAPCMFGQNEQMKGIDISRRDRVLRTLVRNLFDFHQQAIFLTLINEYTDWLRPLENPMAMLESLQDILSDALVVAPLVQAGDLHAYIHQEPAPSTGSGQLPPASSRGKTFFYVFAHQSDDFLPPHHQRLSGCSQNEELAYLFGVPLTDHAKKWQSPRLIMSNFTRSEVLLSEGVMNYWVNFAKTGDPSSSLHDASFPSSPSSIHSMVGSQLSPPIGNPKNRYDMVVWPNYDPIQRKFLMIGSKPRVRDHYHSHRLSFWLNLIPRLHHPGDEQVYLRHHLLADHDNLASYDGIVRQLSFKFLSPLPTIISSIAKNNDKSQEVVDEGDNLTTQRPTPDKKPTTTSTSLMTQSSTAKTMLSTNSSAIIVHENYSTALSVTIGIGCSLLVLNLLVFAGVYYKLDRNNKNQKRNAEATDHKNQSPSHHCYDERSSPDAGLMLAESHPKLDDPSRPSTSPISQDGGIYYQYKQKAVNFQHVNSNSYATNSLRRAYKVSVPTVPPSIGTQIPDGMCVSQIGGRTADVGTVPYGLAKGYQHNCVAKEMAV